MREISLLKELDHPYVVKLRDVVCAENRLQLIFDYVSTDLKSFIENWKPLKDKQIKSIMYQLFSGIAYCHSQRIFHRDLKPNNILYSESHDEIWIADFGLAWVYSLPSKPYTHEVVTLWYWAPEVLLGAKEYSLGVDSWSIGCIFYELVTGSIFLSGDSEIDQLFKIFKLLGTPNESIWPGVTSYEFWKEKFPKFNAIDFEKHC